MGTFDALKDNPVLKSLSKQLNKEAAERETKRRQEIDEHRKVMRTSKCCMNCIHRKYQERCFALIEWCGLSGFHTEDDGCCDKFEWHPDRKPKEEDTSLSLEFDTMGHAEIKENKNEKFL